MRLYISGFTLFFFLLFLSFLFYSFNVHSAWNECCASVSQPATQSHTHPMQSHSPPNPALLSLFFHHTALEVSPAISGTSCSPTALALSLRARGNTATPKHPAAVPVTSGSLARSRKLLTKISKIWNAGKKWKPLLISCEASAYKREFLMLRSENCHWKRGIFFCAAKETSKKSVKAL